MCCAKCESHNKYNRVSAELLFASVSFERRITHAEGHGDAPGIIQKYRCIVTLCGCMTEAPVKARASATRHLRVLRRVKSDQTTGPDVQTDVDRAQSLGVAARASCTNAG
jgi:hypothetical protein